jgi:uncharacterized membrane protein
MLLTIAAVLAVIATAAFWKELLAIILTGATILLLLGVVQLAELVHSAPR